MRETIPPRPLNPASRGEAPGRGRLAGRRILVVGGGQITFDPASDPVGNGRAACRLMAREGAQVAVADINLQSAQDTLDAVRAEGGDGLVIAVDVRDQDQVTAMFDQAIAALGGLDSVLFNVGIFGKIGIDVDPAEFDNILAANLRGALLVGRTALERIGEGGSLVLVSSVAGYKAGSQMVAYDVSKAGLTAIMRQLALLGGRRDIRVNIVVPGLVDTPNGRTAGANRPSRGTGSHLAFRRQATGWEVAYATLFFMSDESAYVTAQQLAVDSGVIGL